MPKSFDTSTVYFHTAIDQPSFISAYAFSLGVYPEEISYIDYNNILPTGADLVDGEKYARKTLGLSENPTYRQNKKVPINTEEGFLYWKDPTTQ